MWFQIRFDSDFYRVICKEFDMQDGSVNAITESFKALYRLITLEKYRHSLFIAPQPETNPKDKEAVVEEQFAFTEKNCLVRTSW